MAGFTVPLSSSPPSTPNSQARNHENVSPFPSMASNPSTTPAGPPPSSANSFTPAGPPPSSVFGSSQLGTGKNLFAKPSFGSSVLGDRGQGNTPQSLFQSTRTKNGTPANLTGRRGFHVPSSSPPQLETGSEGDDEDDYMDEDEEEMDESEDQTVGSADEMVSESEGNYTSATQQFNGTGGWEAYLQSGSPVSTRGAKRSRAGETISETGRTRRLAPFEPGKESPIPAIAKDLALSMAPAQVVEPDDLILGTEELVGQLYVESSVLDSAALQTVPNELNKTWQRVVDTEETGRRQEYVFQVGPGEDASPLAKAAYLSNILLQLHHPAPINAFGPPSNRRLPEQPSFLNSYRPQPPSRTVPIPKVLFDWLNTHHDPYPGAVIELQSFAPNPTAHVNFWDILFSATVRGKLPEIIKLLKEADFKHARTALSDKSDQSGYHGLQLGNIQRVVNRAIQVLEQCPAVQDGDWDVRGNDWAIWGRRVDQASNDLAIFAEGENQDEPEEQPFAAENFGLSVQSHSASLSRAARRAESRVPWTIYQNLKAMYGIISGGATEIVSFAQDWVEAAVALTAWWSGDDDDEVSAGSLMISRRSLSRSQTQTPRSVDVNPIEAYLQRLARSFRRVTDQTGEEAFQIDSLNPVEVGLACVFEGNVEGVIGLLRGWSLVITAAVVEVASSGSWLTSRRGGNMMEGFDASDLMVLSFGQEKNGTDRDEILVQYAQGLFTRHHLKKEAHSRFVREGWEIAIQVLGRLEDAQLANKKLAELLSQLELDSAERVDKLLALCSDLGMDSEGRKIAEKYADSLAESTYNYGGALFYYARAHARRKLKDVLDLLVSFCLVQSAAYPAQSSLDQDLRRLVLSPKQALTDLAQTDVEAARLLQTYLSGYATLRKFYDLRDHEVNLGRGEKAKMRSGERQREALKALVAVIASAEDNIHGGLYDESRDAVVQVDGLLALLGEALVFINQPKPLLQPAQLHTLLSAIESLSSPSLSPRLVSQCHDFLAATLAASRSSSDSSQSPPPSPRALMRKSLSSLTKASTSGTAAAAGFSWSMLGSADLSASAASMSSSRAANRGADGATGEGSGILVMPQNGTRTSSGGNGDSGGGDGEIKRAWDWRRAFPDSVDPSALSYSRDADPASAAAARTARAAYDVVRVLRLGLSRELARLWSGAGARAGAGVRT